jgi:hypothetical protein
MKAVVIVRGEKMEERISDLLGLYGVKAKFIDGVTAPAANTRRVVVDQACGCEEAEQLRGLLATEAPHLTLVDYQECVECADRFDPTDLDTEGRCKECGRCSNCDSALNFDGTCPQECDECGECGGHTLECGLS